MKKELIEFAEKMAAYLKQDFKALRSKSRKRELVYSRYFILAYLYHNKPMRMSNAIIGQIFNRDHSTVNHAAEAIYNLCFTDRSIKEQWLNFYKYASENIGIILNAPASEEDELGLRPTEFMDKHSL